VSQQLNERYAIDILAEEAGGYFAPPSEESLQYLDLLFDVSNQFGIRYYSATPKERSFVDEVTRLTWAKQQEAFTGVKAAIRPAFSA
jgi:hypothetical protein